MQFADCFYFRLCSLPFDRRLAPANCQLSQPVHFIFFVHRWYRLYRCRCHLLTMSLPIGASRIVSRALVRQGFGRSGACPSISSGGSTSTSRTAALRRPLTTAKPQQPPPPPPSATATNSIKDAKTRAGTGNMEGLDGGSDGGVAMSMIPRGPVSWASLGLVAVAAASAVAYYQIERERRLENAMGKIVSASTARDVRHETTYT